MHTQVLLMLTWAGLQSRFACII